MKNAFYIVLVVILISCVSKVKYDKPDDLIPKDQMVDLLYDIHLANGTSGVKNIRLEKNVNYMAMVFEKHKIDSIRFASSNLYYISNTNEYEDIFKEVKKRLESLRLDYQKKRDSVLSGIKNKNKNIKLKGKDTIKINN
jgi:hypothetical protein